MKRIFTLVFCLLVAMCSASAQVYFTDSPESARRQALENDLPIFVDVYAVWCGPCRTMDEDVFSREGVGDFMNDNFVALKIDIDSETGRSVARKYEIKSVPTFLIIDTDGNLLGRTSGARDEKLFIADMKRMLERIKSRRNP
ncbi:MAG: thioredoxin family protein [Alistipes sp.]|nr:thioredoxin family protein [Alistipes sp.]